MANVTTNFLQADDRWETAYLPIKASTALEEGEAVSWEISSNDVTGNLTSAGVENAAGADFVGYMMEPVAATDSDYATSGKLKAVRVPTSRNARAFFTVKGGTFTRDDVGRTVQIDSTSTGLDVDTAGKGARIVKYISSTRGVCDFALPNTETA